MLEGTPAHPYDDFVHVEESMVARYVVSEWL
jgi:hypothetical protein